MTEIGVLQGHARVRGKAIEQIQNHISQRQVVLLFQTMIEVMIDIIICDVNLHIEEVGKEGFP